jgi:hypothetical protein
VRQTIVLVGLLASAGTASARTITLTAEDCERIAVIAARTPRLSWAATQNAANTFDVMPQVQMYGHMQTAVLIRYPIEQIPKEQRVTKAELVLQVTHVDGKARLRLRRLQAEWGCGVCHQYRMVHPQKLEWAQPGAQDAPADRAAKDSALVEVRGIGEYTMDVTEDVDLWYTGAAANRGWIMNVENAYAVYLPAPYSPATGSGKQWRLRITYEPR